MKYGKMLLGGKGFIKYLLTEGLSLFVKKNHTFYPLALVNTGIKGYYYMTVEEKGKMKEYTDLWHKHSFLILTIIHISIIKMKIKQITMWII